MAPIASGMIVGLGTGRAAARGILALARRARREELRIRCVVTSRESEALARSNGLEVIDRGEVRQVDYLFDGADEVDDRLRMLKGGHGAVVGERLVARLARQRVYLVQREKVVTRLGAHRALPVIVVASGVAGVMVGLDGLGLASKVRLTDEGQPFHTDDGHFVIDVTMDDRPVERLAEQLQAIPDVVEYGLFLDECDVLWIESGGAPLERRERAGGTGKRL